MVNSEAPFESLAKRFKVSPLVIGRRAMDLGLIEDDDFFVFYHHHTQAERQMRQPRTRGRDSHEDRNARVGRLFASHVIRTAKEGRIGFGEAYDLTGLNGGAFQAYACELAITLP